MTPWRQSRLLWRIWRFHTALEAIWSAMTVANGYFADQAPWSVRKTDPERADTILFRTVDAIRALAILAQWVIPDGAARILDLVGQPLDKRGFGDLGVALVPGTDLPAPAGVFPRLELPTDA
jgi:methionyl-tRNA synthetase